MLVLTRSRWGWTWLVVAWGLLLAARAGAVPPYFFEDFEPGRGWGPGGLEQMESAVRLVEGEARIVSRDEAGSTQFLRVGPSDEGPTVRVEAGPLAAEPVVYGEVLARPVALTEPKDEEFLDFDGAVLGCFRVGKQGEICALFDTPEEGEGVWISTGVRFDLDAEGRIAEWVQVRIRLDRRTRRWDLFLNDEPVLAGLRAITVEDPKPMALWLYGHAESGCEYDDVLLTTVPPAELEVTLRSAELSSARRMKPIVRRYPQIVQRTQSTETLRSQTGKFPPSGQAPQLRGWRLSLDTGNHVYENKIPASGNEPAITAYAPGYDEAGNRLPAVITLTADASLKPGTDLSRLRWRVSELLGYPDKQGEVAGEGDFRTGLVQTFTLTSEWTRKATSVRVWVERGE